MDALEKAQRASPSAHEVGPVTHPVGRSPEGASPDELLARFYDRTSARLYGLLLRILEDARLAERLLVEIYLEVAPRLVHLEESRAIMDVLVETRRRALRALEDAAAESKSRGSADPTIVPMVPDAASGTRAQAALARLVGMDREMLELAYFGGLSPRAIATRLGLREDTVKVRLRAGLLGFTHARPSTTTKEAVS